MADALLPDLILYGRPDCSLCDEARDILHALLAERQRAGRATPNLIELDIETDPDLHRELFGSIPVVDLGGRRLELVTSAVKLRHLLSEVLDAEATPA